MKNERINEVLKSMKILIQAINEVSELADSILVEIDDLKRMPTENPTMQPIDPFSFVRVEQQDNASKFFEFVNNKESMRAFSSSIAEFIKMVKSEIVNDNTVNKPVSEPKESTNNEMSMINPEILSIKLEDMDLSVRTLNCLVKWGKIETIEDLVKYTINDLMKFRGFGRFCLSEILSKLDELGITLKEE